MCVEAFVAVRVFLPCRQFRYRIASSSMTLARLSLSLPALGLQAGLSDMIPRDCLIVTMRLRVFEMPIFNPPDAD